MDFALLNSDETALIGRWLEQGPEIVADETCHRINSLVTKHLSFVTRSKDGWSSLYRDPADGRFWEHVYPQSDFQGGGPPAMYYLSPGQALARYGVGA